jgi:hypothetical protein
MHRDGGDNIAEEKTQSIQTIMTIDLSSLPIDPVRGRNVRFVVDDYEVTAHYLIYQTYDAATAIAGRPIGLGMQDSRP